MVITDHGIVATSHVLASQAGAQKTVGVGKFTSFRPMGKAWRHWKC